MADTQAALTDLPEVDRLAMEQWLLSFDQDWKPEKLKQFLEQIPFEESAPRQVALEELVKVDLERQWKAGHDRRLESYLDELPDLGTREQAAPDLILAEHEAAREADGPSNLKRC